MLDKVIRTIKDKNMIKAGDNVICALSGGADSMALLYALYKTREELGFSLYAAHLNHSVRGADADEDALFVEDFCKNIGIKIFLKKVDVPKLAKERGIGEEECGREERYRFFEETAQSLGGGKIATGHHMNDRAETVLFNLFRGSGSVKGIPYTRGNIIRPLMNVTRKETEEYLIKNNISWREDYTNKECKYSRNVIRNVIFNEIEKNFPKAVEKIVKSEELAREDNEYLDMLASSSGAFVKGEIIKDKFICLHECLKRRVIVAALREWNCPEIDGETVNAVYETVMGQTGKGRDLKGGIRVYNNYSKIICKQTDKIKSLEYEQVVNLGENLEISAFDGIWTVKTVDKKQKMRDNKTMIILDADKLGGKVSVRQRKDGDYIYPKGLGGKKKIKQLFIDLKIPREKRDEISLLAMGSEVLFIPTIRGTEKYQPDEKTEKYFVAEFKPVIY